MKSIIKKGVKLQLLRKLILNVPGNVVGSGRFRHVRLAPNSWLHETIEQTATMEEVSASAEALSKLSVELITLLNNFKVDKVNKMDEDVIEQQQN